MIVVETGRLRLRHLVEGDAAFIVELLNDPGFLRFIGDRGIRTLDDALGYIASGPGASYAKHGHGLYCVETLAGGTPIGICGLLKRDTLPDADLGYAFLPAGRGHGYAQESCLAVLARARDVHGLSRVIAIVNPDNADSIKVLERLGFRYEEQVKLGADDAPVSRYAWSAPVT